MKAANTLFLLLAAALAFSCFAWWEQDDFYIHLQYVRNLVERGEWSFSAGTPSYGTTSPLWILVVSVPSVFGVPAPFAAKMLSVVFSVACVFLLLRAGDLFRHPAIHAAAIIALIADHWFRLAAGSGMEATLTAFLVLGLGLSLIRIPSPTDSQLAGYGALSGALVLSRPEFFVLPAIMLVAPRGRKRSAWVRAYMIYLIAFAAVLAPWVWYALAHFGTVVANTVALKAAAPKAALLPPLSGLVPALQRQASFFGLMYVPELLAILAAVFLVARRKASDGRPVPLAAWGLVAFLPTLYLLTHARGGESISYRYGAPILPLLVAVGFLQLDRVLAGRNARTSARFAIAATLCVIAAGITLSVMHTPSLRKSRDYLQNVLIPYGRWLGEHTAQNARVAAYDVGAIAYFSRRPILDLVGLNSAEVIPLLDPREAPRVNIAAIVKFRPDYLVSFVHADTRGLYAGLPIAETIFTSSVAPYRFGLPQAGPPRPCYLWRLDWSNAQPK